MERSMQAHVFFSGFRQAPMKFKPQATVKELGLVERSARA